MCWKNIHSYALLVWLFPLTAGHVFSQSDSLAIQKVSSEGAVAKSDSLGSMVTTDTLSFCGCQSKEAVMQCADCFIRAGAVLKTGYDLSYVSKTVIRGSCWDFANEVFKRAAVSKETLFASSKAKKYANPEMVRPGDWIYHINYAYGNVEHSAIFVCWKDKAAKQAITLSYVGGNRSVPGRLDIADLRSITSIFRPIPH